MVRDFDGMQSVYFNIAKSHSSRNGEQGTSQLSAEHKKSQELTDLPVQKAVRRARLSAIAST
jgi:hypothetical protein